VPAPILEGEATAGIEAPDPGAGIDGESRLAEMRAAQKAVRSVETGNRSPAEKAEAWRRFLDAYEQDLTETREDDEIRAYARRRRGYWEGRSAAETDRISDTGEPSPSTGEPETTAVPPRQPDAGSRETRRAPAEAETPEPVLRETEPAPRPRRVDPAKIRTREEARSFLAERGIPVNRESFRTAMARDDPVAVRLLLLAGPGARSGVMEDLLEEALDRGKLRVADALLSAGVEPPGGILEDAAGDGRLALVRFLWERRIGDREEALEEALDEEYWEVARYLVEVAGAPLAEFEDEAEDLLVTAAEEGDRNAVAWLIRAGLDVRDDAGEEALEEAESNEHWEVADLLRRARSGGER
ncbi:MAG: hypothetical protein R3234_03920, partial [Thermoanaerobaculia bacterium]|nr:hypothetical protein [Thermoanaerobaculia bacterium]